MARAFQIDISLHDDITPILRELVARLEDRKELHQYIGMDAESLTRDHVRQAAGSRHTTAERLGARPTGYLERAEQGIESAGDSQAAVVSLTGDVDIFSRAFGEVEVRGHGKKLTIPAHADAYGKRAGELGELKVLVWRAAGGYTSALGTEDESAERTVYFWLVDQVTLPADEGLLPTSEQFAAAAETAALDYIGTLLRRAESE